MNKYIEKLKTSADLRNKMLVNFESGSRYDSDAETSYLTHLTDEDIGVNPNTFVDVKTAELMWDGWDEEYKVLSVLVKKFVNEKLVDEKTFLAVYSEDTCDYYTIPKSLARHEGL
jgi:hypothetical protein